MELSPTAVGGIKKSLWNCRPLPWGDYEEFMELSPTAVGGIKKSLWNCRPLPWAGLGGFSKRR